MAVPMVFVAAMDSSHFIRRVINLWQDTVRTPEGKAFEHNSCLEHGQAMRGRSVGPLEAADGDQVLPAGAVLAITQTKMHAIT
jgi:hypothetical protein